MAQNIEKDLEPGHHEAWAKLDAVGNALPLVEHAADVAAVFAALLAGPAWRRTLEATAGRPLTPCDVDRLLVLAFLHDLGKANHGFWAQRSEGNPRVGHTSQTAPLLLAPSVRDQPIPRRLQGMLRHWGAADHFFAAMAHHGRPLEAYAGDESCPDLGRLARDGVLANRYPTEHWRSMDGYDPLGQLGALLDAAERRFPAGFEDGPDLPAATPFISMFCGLLTLADWLGSDTALFPVAGPQGPEREVLRRLSAADAVAGRGLGQIDTPLCEFATAFDVAGPRGLQRVADNLDLGPVALLEAETGAGKTEAALWRWLALRRAGLVDGLYFALPTRAAAVQLHGRVQATLDRVFGAGAVEAVLAVPGYLRAGEAEGRALPEFKVLWPDDHVGDGRWAAEQPKRFLAARVAVGTVDQALMAALQVRHAHLRAATLSRSLLVVDEVHASDVFMGEILLRLLANHRAFGGHALLLSATLAAEARTRLLGQPAAPSLAEASTTPYPALSGSGHEVIADSSGHRTAKHVALEAWPAIDDAAAIATRAIGAARNGASVLVVRNSVSGAIAVARAVEREAPELAFRVRGVATLHHGRFAPGDRRLQDAAVEAAFGKARDARGRVLCGTQTLEQSLDIDADLLITDLAPIDVLLQRVGRLHRHPWRERGSFRQARAVVLVPEDRDLSAYLGRVRDRHGLGPVRDGKGVYPDMLVLEATWRLIEANPEVSIPADNRRLIEGALHRESLDALAHALGTRWLNHANAQEGAAIAERCLARRWTLDLCAPFATLLFPDMDDPVATRLGTRDRLVTFDPPFDGPFGAKVDRLTIPAWMAGGVPLDAVPIIGEMDAGRIVFELGARRFFYGRWGLELDKQQA